MNLTWQKHALTSPMLVTMFYSMIGYRMHKMNPIRLEASRLDSYLLTNPMFYETWTHWICQQI